MKLKQTVNRIALCMLLAAFLLPALHMTSSDAARMASGILLLGAVVTWTFSARVKVRMSGGNGPYFRKTDPAVTFSSVAANESAKNSLRELADYLKVPQKYAEIGARIPHGVLLYGPPGTGKTLLARALANEANVPFLAVNGSDFVEMYAGVGAGRVRNVFQRARKLGKCVIFIDEIDAVGHTRGVNSSDERDQTLNALLGEMSGFTPSDGIIVIAATNRREVLDPALLRAGRFDRHIEVGMPCMEERLEILKLHVRNKPVSESVDLSTLARQTVFFSGASLENLVNEAAIRAVRRGAKEISADDFQSAYLSVIAGNERKMHRTDDEIRTLALHEASHAVVSHVLMPNVRLSRVSIVPSENGAAGYNLTVPEEKLLYTKHELLCRMAVLLAGRAGEEMFLGDENVTGGAADDLKRAAEIAAGMAGDLGLAGEMCVSAAVLSRLTGSGTDSLSRAKALLTEQYARAKEVLNANTSVLLSLTEALMQNDALDESALDRILPLSNDSDGSTKEVN